MFLVPFWNAGICIGLTPGLRCVYPDVSLLLGHRTRIQLRTRGSSPCHRLRLPTRLWKRLVSCYSLGLSSISRVSPANCTVLRSRDLSASISTQLRNPEWNLRAEWWHSISCNYTIENVSLPYGLTLWIYLSSFKVDGPEHNCSPVSRHICPAISRVQTCFHFS
jgi:hypothetical protein